MSVEEIKAMVMRFVDEPWNKGNVAVVDEVCAPGYSVRYLPEIEKGDREALKKAILQTRASAADFHAEVEDIIVEGDRVAYLWKMSLTNEKGNLETTVGITLLRLAGGKIVDDRFVSADVESQ